MKDLADNLTNKIRDVARESVSVPEDVLAVALSHKSIAGFMAIRLREPTTPCGKD